MQPVPVLAAALVAATAFAAPTLAAPAASCTPTQQDSFGPFGRGMPPLRSSIGHGHVLSGVVLSALNCRPLRNARVEYWQESPHGGYTRATSGTVVTDARGRFRFEGPFPPSEQGFPHIHLRVLAQGHKPLLTRYEPAQGERTGSVRLVLEPAEL
jgi:protocatechuate 3,4-dioxygenase beta subunit